MNVTGGGPLIVNCPYSVWNTGGGGTGQYTINGTGFGTTPMSPFFLDWENESAGAIPATSNNGDGTRDIAGLVIDTPGPGSSIVTGADHTSPSSVVYSGTKCLSHNFVSGGGFPKLYKVLSGANRRAYFCCHFRTRGSITGNSVWKFARIGDLGSGGVYYGGKKAGASYSSSIGDTVPQTFAGEIDNLDGAGGITSWHAQNTGIEPELAYAEDTWHFYECEFDAGTPDGNDCFFYERIDGVETVAWENRPFLTGADSNLPEWFISALNGVDVNPNITHDFDNMFYAESNSRVVMTDNPVYSLSTKWAVQPDVSWVDTNIVCEKKKQGFSVGETAYLHTIVDRAVTQSGAGFTVTEDDS